jgi:hypothetical protein
VIGPKLIVNDDVQKRCVNLQLTIVLDQSKLPELVHEGVDPRTGRPDPRRQGFLADLGNHRFELSILAEIGEEQEYPSEALFA